MCLINIRSIIEDECSVKWVGVVISCSALYEDIRRFILLYVEFSTFMLKSPATSKLSHARLKARSMLPSE